MGVVRKSWVAAGLLLLGGALPSARAQSSVAFVPQVGSIPDGAVLNVTPVVSADRRYVRLTVNAQFISNVQFDNFVVPGGVTGGGGFGGGGFGGGGGGGGGGGLGGGLGGGGGGLRSVGTMQNGAFDPLAMNMAPAVAPEVPSGEVQPPRRARATPKAKAAKVAKRRPR